MSGRVDVAILGGGLAGLSLARQLLLETDRRVLVIDKRRELPAPEQKVGEATVQLSGYYFSKVLDLEEHLLHDHLMKYNLRFYWKGAGNGNDSLEGYSQAYIRPFSNLASYQLDRNLLEAELLRLNGEDPRFSLAAPARLAGLELTTGGEGPHRLVLERDGERQRVLADWVVDCTGRGRVLARRLGLARRAAIRHGASYMWVDGTLNVERLSDLSPRERRLHPARGACGHLPLWLATNHFMGEGFWFWVIPLKGKTSLGLVYDKEVIDRRQVATPEELVEWVCREFPLFARDLPGRRVLHFAGMPDFADDCAQTLSEDRWAISGMAGRFSDPLYSPGGDLIALHNTLITDAVTSDGEELTAKCRAYEQLMRSLYEAYVPSYTESYNALGDPEAFTLKYTWELTVYFAFYVFPFINDLFTDRRFLIAFFNRFGRLGPINRNLQRFFSAYANWAREHRRAPAEPVFHDFTDLGPLAAAEKTFYRVGVGADEAKRELGGQLANLEELARYVLAYLASVVVGDPAALVDRAFVSGIDPVGLDFDPAALRRRWAACARSGGGEPYPWSFDPRVMERFRQARRRPAEPVPATLLGPAPRSAAAGEPVEAAP